MIERCLVVDVVEPAPLKVGPCVACNLGAHHDELALEDCGCPCAWSAGMRRSAIAVTARDEPAR